MPNNKEILVFQGNGRVARAKLHEAKREFFAFSFTISTNLPKFL